MRRPKHAAPPVKLGVSPAAGGLTWIWDLQGTVHIATQNAYQLNRWCATEVVIDGVRQCGCFADR
jgi:hypothetical protein